ncbi:hypothetical protein [Dinoroseobacter sp. S124A]|uniref:hypothetical protein n=1 Tax=Dinoroseobacter sp. S124A TaxID=3415128 RepID=UPI003C7E356E
MPTEALFGACSTPTWNDELDVWKTVPLGADGAARKIELKSVMIPSYSSGTSASDAAGKAAHSDAVPLTDATLRETPPGPASDAVLV